MASMLDGIKDRPVIIVDYGYGTATVLKCTTKFNQEYHSQRIVDYADAGLSSETFVDPVRRIVSLDSLVWRIGELSEHDRGRFGV